MRTGTIALALAAAFALAASAPHGAAASPSDDFDRDLAHRLATMNAIAYCPKAKVEAWACDSCDPGVTVRDVYKEPTEDLQAYVATEPGTVFVVFKGTDPLSLKEWIADLETVHLGESDLCDGCSLHLGFALSEQNMHPTMDSLMMSAVADASGSPRVVIVGHSLGASIATIFAFRTRRDHPDLDVTLYTFGNPRVGNGAFADAFDALVTFPSGADGPTKAFRISHRHDIVPHVPPLEFGFKHHRALFYQPDKDANDYVYMDAENDGQSPVWGGINDVVDHGVYGGVKFLPYIDVSIFQPACG